MMELLVDKKSIIPGISTRHILGKQVLTKAGLVVGKIKDIRIDESQKVQGVIISRRFWQKKLYVDTALIVQLSVHAVILKREPYNTLKGRRLFDHDGKPLGRVVSVQYGEKLENVKVKKLFRRKKTINADKFELREKSLLLKE